MSSKSLRALRLRFAVIGVGLLVGIDVSPALAERPNVLIFFTDDHRPSAVGAFGNDEIETPHLDELARRGTTFSRAYMMGGMTGATCVPSRAMLHTARHLFHLRDRGSSLSADDTTLGETFRAAGYATFFTGKRHSLSRDRIRRGYSHGGVVMGFGGYLTDKRRMPMHDWDPSGVYRKEDAFVVSGSSGFPKVPVPAKRDRNSVPAGPYSTALYVDPAVRWLASEEARRPWLMYVALSAPHDPHQAPEEIRQRYDADKITLPPNFLAEHPFDNGDMDSRDEKLLPKPRDRDQVRSQMADYYAAVTYLDSQFGRLVEALEKNSQLADTIILFAGDSGLAVGQHGLMGKQNLYDDSGVRIPVIMAGPGIPVAANREGLVTSCDLFPTLCELTGVSTPTGLDGKSLKPMLDDESFEIRDCVYLGYREFQRAIVESRFKLIEYVRVTHEGESVGARATQLFDLSSDPWESRNLADDPKHRPTLRRLQDRLGQLRQRYDDGTDRGRDLCPEMDAQYRRFWDNYESKPSGESRL